MNDSFDLGLVTRKDVREYVRNAEIYSPVDFGFLGHMGDVSDVSAGEGRWRWLLKDLTDWRGMRILDLGANNCLYALRSLQKGAAEAQCVERNPEFYRQARFVRAAVEQMEGRTFPLTIHQTDIHAFLTSTPFPEEYFDLTLALCSIYYLERDAIAENMKVIGRISKECWLQANVGTPRDTEDFKEKASTAFLEKQLRAAGFDDVRVICPKGYIRPLLIGKKSVRLCEQGPSVR